MPKYRHALTGAVIGVSDKTPQLAALVECDENWLDVTAIGDWLAAEDAHLTALGDWLAAEDAHLAAVGSWLNAEHNHKEGASNAGDTDGRAGGTDSDATAGTGRGTARRNRAAGASKRPRGRVPVAVDRTDTDAPGDQPSDGRDGSNGADQSVGSIGDSAGDAEPAG